MRNRIAWTDQRQKLLLQGLKNGVQMLLAAIAALGRLPCLKRWNGFDKPLPCRLPRNRMPESLVRSRDATSIFVHRNIWPATLANSWQLGYDLWAGAAEPRPTISGL